MRGLQWGRNFAVAETILEYGIVAGVHGFNGAATLQLRKQYVRYGSPCNSKLASMGPQLCSCGNLGAPGAQHVPAEASMGPQLCSCGNHGIIPPNTHRVKASMGPQLCSCGNTEPAEPAEPAEPSFNGAATLQLRKPPKAPDYRGPKAVLQWGRNFAVAETGSRGSRPLQVSISFNGAATLQLRKRQNR